MLLVVVVGSQSCPPSTGSPTASEPSGSIRPQTFLGRASRFREAQRPLNLASSASPAVLVRCRRRGVRWPESVGPQASVSASPNRPCACFSGRPRPNPNPRPLARLLACLCFDASSMEPRWAHHVHGSDHLGVTDVLRSSCLLLPGLLPLLSTASPTPLSLQW